MIRLEQGYRLGTAAKDPASGASAGWASQPLAGVDTVDGCQLSEVHTAESRLRGLDLPYQSSREINMLICGGPDWCGAAL
ncbi:hypothetical protein [Paracoccus halophilus]|uniref:hypothetical protein n=1 Tax=Paracoccus halophilus TaxID=376733 RepID=UPI000AF3F089|nr:hypothetical protein [Paracoccus halophilus]